MYLGNLGGRGLGQAFFSGETRWAATDTVIPSFDECSEMGMIRKEEFPPPGKNDASGREGRVLGEIFSPFRFSCAAQTAFRRKGPSTTIRRNQPSSGICRGRFVFGRFPC